MAAVASRAVLERESVAGVILGARLGQGDHIAENAQIFAFDFDNEVTAPLRLLNLQTDTADFFLALLIALW